MTFVGKILVIVLMVFAIIFMSISTVVFSTATNWKEETKKQKAKVAELQKDIGEVKAAAAADANQLKAEQDTHKTQVSGFQNQIKDLDGQNNRIQELVTAARKELEVAQENAKLALDEAEAHRKETLDLRDKLKAVQKQANDFKLRQTVLNDEILTLNRQIEAAKTNNENLRRRVAVLATALHRNNLPFHAEDYEHLTAPPESVEGEVLDVDARNQKVDISVGADDGLAIGHELYLYRRKGPDAGYLGKIKIDLVEGDRASGHVINGRTLHGKKIKKGDNVSTQIHQGS